MTNRMTQAKINEGDYIYIISKFMGKKQQKNYKDNNILSRNNSKLN